MQNFPPIILNYLDRVLIQDRSPAYLIVDHNGVLTGCGGSVSDYGLENLQTGRSVAHQAHFLEGLLPLESTEILLPCLEVAPKHFADIHLLHGNEGDIVSLLDATSAEIQTGLLHQKANDLQILRNHHSQLLNLLTGLEIALLEKTNDTEFQIIGTAADWLEHCGLRYMPEKNVYEIAESLDFFHNFVLEAEEFWSTESGRFKSGPWVETDANGKEWYFEATAMRTGKQEIFLIERVAPFSDMRFALLQKAREQSLEYLHLARREKALKEKETRNRILLQAVPDWIFRINRSGMILDLKATMGKNPSMFTEFIGQPLSEIFPKEVSEDIIRGAIDAIAAQQLQICYFQLGSNDAGIDFEARIVATGPNEVVVIIRDLPK
jgi:PAS domain-containing protein